ncbi:hypothetical protein J7K19_02085, partial [bacterium]|nr:hypothetical protein [bacterium]
WIGDLMDIKQFMERTNPLGRGTKQPEIVAKIYPGVVRIEVTPENRERVYYLLKDLGCKLIDRTGKRF